MPRLNCARTRYRIRRGTPQNEVDLAHMAARDRERWLATELLAPHAAYFLARHQWRKMRARGADLMLAIPWTPNGEIMVGSA